jgi:hypothetical protein
LGEVLDKYERWLNTGLKRLSEEFLKGSFKPQNESDIKCHLYHTLLQIRQQIKGLTDRHLVFSELSSPTSQERIDLALGWWRKRGSIFEPRILIEIKETSLGHLIAHEIEERVKGDVDKLRRYKKMLEKDGDMNILKYLRKPAVIFFFRGAGRHGIGVRTHQQLKELQKNYSDLAFLWGPC